MVEEQEFRKANKDCFIPEDFAEVHSKYAELPEYLRRWCAWKEETIIEDLKLELKEQEEALNLKICRRQAESTELQAKNDKLELMIVELENVCDEVEELLKQRYNLSSDVSQGLGTLH